MNINNAYRYKNKPGSATIFNALSKENINVDMIVQSGQQKTLMLLMLLQYQKQMLKKLKIL